MLPSSRNGIALLEMVLALVLLSAALVALGPVVGRTAQVMTRGRTLLEGTAMVVQARESVLVLPAAACGGGSSGQDSGRFVKVHWTTAPAAAGIEFVAVIQDHGRRFPVETLATVHPCRR